MKYGEEELDLSYRLIAAGYDIVYEPGIVAYHWPEPSAVKSAQQGGHSEIYYQVKNRFLLMYSYIPARCMPSYAGVWLCRYLVTSLKRGVLRDYWAGLRDGVRELQGRKRLRLNHARSEKLRGGKEGVRKCKIGG